MTVTFEIGPETQAGLAELANAGGVTPEEYVRMMVETAVPRRSDLTPEERAKAWLEAAPHFPYTVPLSDEAISRESMYGDRG